MKRLFSIAIVPYTVVFIVGALIFYFVFVDMEPTHDIGRVPVKGLSTVYFDLEQENEFDMVTAIYYGISTQNKMTVAPMKHLIGTHDFITSPDDFSANSVDSIIYLTWGDTSEVYAVYDLKTTRSSQDKDDLLTKLKKKKPYLTGNWNK